MARAGSGDSQELEDDARRFERGGEKGVEEMHERNLRNNKLYSRTRERLESKPKFLLQIFLHHSRFHLDPLDIPSLQTPFRLMPSCRVHFRSPPFHLLISIQHTPPCTSTIRDQLRHEPEGGENGEIVRR